jgi:hypothetical protein
MSALWHTLGRSFAELRLEQPLLVALVLLCGVTLTVFAVGFAARRIRPPRLHDRSIVGRPVLISWRDGVGPRKSDDGFCQDLSVGGASLLLPFPLDVRTRVNLQMSEVKLSHEGVVRRCGRIGRQYLVGVQFDRPAATFAKSS